MVKIKVLLIATFFLFSTYSVAHASNLDQVSAIGEERLLLEELLEEIETTSDKSTESDIPFQEEIDRGEVVTYPPVKVEEKYAVKEGDNLYRIALTHEIPLAALIGWNDLTSDLIHPGDELIVSGDEEEARILEAKMTEKVAAILKEKSPSPSSSPTVSEGKELVVTATAYTAYCDGCSGTTAYGIDLRSNPEKKVIAVDPKVVPLGTKVWVEGYGEAIAGDVGGAIKGHKIDVFIPSYNRAMEWGVQEVKMKVLN